MTDPRTERDPDFVSAEEAIEEIRRGRVIIVTDDEDRENEGDMIVAAEEITPETINLLAVEGRGLICVPMTEERLRELDLGPMVGENTAHMQTGFTVSVDYVHGTTTGISAGDRSKTVAALVDPATRPVDLARPGHVFPLSAHPGGVLRRAGHTEATVDLARLAGLTPAGVLCEVMNDRGDMARGEELKAIAKRLGLKLFTIRDLVQHRMRTETLVTELLATHLPTRHGVFDLTLFEDHITDGHHVALTLGDVGSGEPVLTRIHSQCLTGDVFGSIRCDCGSQIHEALAAIREEGRGAVVYMAQEGRGIGLVEKLRAYRLQDEGLDTVEANVELGFRPDERDFGTAAQIVSALGIASVRLLTNNPDKVSTLESYGVRVSERVPLEIAPVPENAGYLATKRDKLGHQLSLGPGNGKPRGGRRAIGERSAEAGTSKGERHGAAHSR